MKTAEHITAVTGFHQFDKTQLDRAVFDPVQKCRQMDVINILHQYHIHFHLLKTGLKRGIDTTHHLHEFILPGDSVKLARVETVNADIHGAQPGSTPVTDIPCHAVTIGGHGNGADILIFADSGNDIGKIAAHGRLTAGQTDFFRAQLSKRAGHPADFAERKKGCVRLVYNHQADNSCNGNCKRLSRRGADSKICAQRDLSVVQS